MADLPISLLPLATTGYPDSLMVIVNYNPITSGRTESIPYSAITQSMSGGTSGTSGINGTSGTNGTNGASGTNGTSGFQGDKGGLQYTYDGQFTFPNSGGFMYQTSDGDFYQIRISPTDNDGNSLLNYFNTISGSRPSKVYITSNNNNIATLDIWNISSITYVNPSPFDPYFSLNGSLIGNATTMSSIPVNCAITILFDGTNGTSGTNGTNGASGTNGTSGVNGTSGTSGTGGGGGGTGLLSAQNIFGNFYGNSSYGATAAITAAATVNSNSVVNQLQVYPFTPNKTIISSELSVNSTSTSAGGTAKVLIYSNNVVNNAPSTKVFESAILNMAVAGLKTISTSFTFTSGTTYWLGWNASTTVQMSCIPTSGLIPLLTTGGGNTPTTALIMSGTTVGSEPTTFNLNGISQSPQVSILIKPII